MQAYSGNLVDYHLILDLLPSLARLYLSGQLPATLSYGQVRRARAGSVGAHAQQAFLEPACMKTSTVLPSKQGPPCVAQVVMLPTKKTHSVVPSQPTRLMLCARIAA